MDLAACSNTGLDRPECCCSDCVRRLIIEFAPDSIRTAMMEALASSPPVVPPDSGAPGLGPIERLAEPAPPAPISLAAARRVREGSVAHAAHSARRPGTTGTFPSVAERLTRPAL